MTGRRLVLPGGMARVVLVSVLALLASAGCGAGTSPAPSVHLTVSGAWIRVAPTIEQPTAAYLVIAEHANTPDALIGASSPAAAMIEIHETTTGMDDMTGMGSRARLDIPAGGMMKLEPGGFHLMVTGLRKPLVAGTMVELDLLFEHAGTIVVQADVRAG